MYKRLIAAAAALVFCFSAVGCSKTNSDSSSGATLVSSDAEVSATENSAEIFIDLNKQSGTVRIDKGGRYSLSGKLSGGVHVSCGDEVTLVLNGADIENGSAPAIYTENASILKIELAEGTSSSLSDGESRDNDKLKGCIYSVSDVQITGSGILNVKGIFGHGIVSKKNFEVCDGAVLNIQSKTDCIHADNRIEIKGGTLSLESAEDECIQSEGELYIDSGAVSCETAADAIHAETCLEINGGSLIISKAREGLESNSDIVINGGVIDINCSDDGINAPNSITVNDGEIKVISSENDAIDSNGSIIINGGKVLAVGSGAPECSIDGDNRGFTLNGGEVVAIGGAYSVPNDGMQKFLNFSISETNALGMIEVRDAAGNVVIESELPSYELKSGGMGFGDGMNLGMEGEMPQKSYMNGEFPQKPGFDGERMERPEIDGEPPRMPEMNGDMEGKAEFGSEGDGQLGGRDKMFQQRGNGMGGGQNILISVSDLDEGTYTLYSDGAEIGACEIK